MSQAVSRRAVGTVVRVTLVEGDDRTDLALPGSVPVAEIVPGLARRLGMLEVRAAVTGYRLTRTDGTELAPDQSLAAQGVEDGALLALVARDAGSSGRVYDDLVEAVSDAVEDQHRAWTPADSARMTLVATLVLVVTGSVVLLTADDSSLLVPVVAGAAAALSLGVTGVLAALRRTAASMTMLGSTAVLALTSGLALGVGPMVGEPLAFGGLGVLAVGALALPFLGSVREYAAVPILVGLVLLALGGLPLVTDLGTGQVAAGIVAVSGIVLSSAPWIALSMTGIRVTVPRNQAELDAERQEIRAARVRSEFLRGSRLLLAMRLSGAAAILLATPHAVATGIWGTALVLVVCVAFVLGVREIYARRDVVVMTSTGVVGAAVAGLAVVVVHPTWWLAVAIAVAALTVGIVGMAVLSPGPRPGLQRVGDTLEVICVLAVLPLAAFASGVV
ncbi:type VII secretion integral membrane protein EccD [Georgenia sp. Z1491]|uniref:type VII secretion integral membrane protein EccD n=1 Tax=Georgenia sp. Z1491 TaxID=3416707 RepID=UPI003CF34707